jgi:hypothetical protein
MTMNCIVRFSASNLLAHPLRRSKFARAMHPVADPDGRSVPDARKTSQYATPQHQMYQSDGTRHASWSVLTPLFFLPGLKQST